jgi:hypothetical protein
VEEAAADGAVGEHVVIVIVPFAGRARQRCALEQQRTHRLQSSSSSRFTAGCAGFFILSQSGERPERYGESLRFETIAGI